MPWSAEQMFDLVVDVERYPEFLPGWSEVRVRQRSADELLVDQVLRLAGIRFAFSSRARPKRADSLRISAVPGLFRRLEIRWFFTGRVNGGCKVVLEIDFELRSRLLGIPAAGFFSLAAADVLPRFEERAREMFGCGTA